MACCCGVSSPCCPGVSLPQTLFAVFVGDATVTITWNGSEWVGQGTMNCGVLLNVVLDCGVFQPGVWTLILTYEPSGIGQQTTPPSTVQCSPLQITYTATTPIVGPPGGCPASYALTIHG